MLHPWAMFFFFRGLIPCPHYCYLLFRELRAWEIVRDLYMISKKSFFGALIFLRFVLCFWEIEWHTQIFLLIVLCETFKHFGQFFVFLLSRCHVFFWKERSFMAIFSPIFASSTKLMRLFMSFLFLFYWENSERVLDIQILNRQKEMLQSITGILQILWNVL